MQLDRVKQHTHIDKPRGSRSGSGARLRVVGDEHAEIVAAHRLRLGLAALLNELQQQAQHLEVLLLELVHVLAPEQLAGVHGAPLQLAAQHLSAVLLKAAQDLRPGGTFASCLSAMMTREGVGVVVSADAARLPLFKPCIACGKRSASQRVPIPNRAAPTRLDAGLEVLLHVGDERRDVAVAPGGQRARGEALGEAAIHHVARQRKVGVVQQVAQAGQRHAEHLLLLRALAHLHERLRGEGGGPSC